MIRNRDLIIFFSILLLLGLAIGVTVLRDEWGALHTASLAFDITAPKTATSTYSAVTETKTINREENIARLREALAKNQSLVEPSPSVETPTTTLPTSTALASSDTKEQIRKCGEDSTKYIHAWPLSGVIFKEESPLRIVEVAAPEVLPADGAGTSTASNTVAPELVLLKTPVAPALLAEPHCVPSDAIGVTTSGSLIFNSDATFYRGYGAEFLIGYARDGYPIYGFYQGAVDSCGGYMAASGYRYTVSADRNFIIGCFMAMPAAFTGL